MGQCKAPPYFKVTVLAGIVYKVLCMQFTAQLLMQIRLQCALCKKLRKNQNTILVFIDSYWHVLKIIHTFSFPSDATTNEATPQKIFLKQMRWLKLYFCLLQAKKQKKYSIDFFFYQWPHEPCAYQGISPTCCLSYWVNPNTNSPPPHPQPKH